MKVKELKRKTKGIKEAIALNVKAGYYPSNWNIEAHYESIDLQHENWFSFEGEAVPFVPLSDIERVEGESINGEILLGSKGNPYLSTLDYRARDCHIEVNKPIPGIKLFYWGEVALLFPIVEEEKMEEWRNWRENISNKIEEEGQDPPEMDSGYIVFPDENGKFPQYIYPEDSVDFDIMLENADKILS